MFQRFPIEPSADMRSSAHDVREMFVALVGVGFTEDQALVLVGQMVGAAIIAASNNPEGQS